TLDRFAELGTQLLELVEARLEVGALRGELLEPQLLRRVLLLRERVHCAEGLATALQAFAAPGGLVAVLALRPFGRRGPEAPARGAGRGGRRRRSGRPRPGGHPRRRPAPLRRRRPPRRRGRGPRDAAGRHRRRPAARPRRRRAGTVRARRPAPPRSRRRRRGARRPPPRRAT